MQLLDILDAHLFFYGNAFPLISVVGLVNYLQGEINPSDDIAGYTWHWFDRAALPALDIVALYQFEIFEKALFVIDLYQASPDLSFLKYKWKSIT